MGSVCEQCGQTNPRRPFGRLVTVIRSTIDFRGLLMFLVVRLCAPVCVTTKRAAFRSEFYSIVFSNWVGFEVDVSILFEAPE